MDDQCQYKFENQRCPLIGTVAGRSKDQWYCFNHWRLLDDPIKSKQFMEKTISDSQCNLSKHKNWRAELLNQFISQNKKVGNVI